MSHTKCTRLETPTVHTISTNGLNNPVSLLYVNDNCSMALIGTAKGNIKLILLNDKKDKFNNLTYVTICDSAVEGVRSAYLSENEKKLYVAIGDRFVRVYELSQASIQESGGVPYTDYSYDRTHSFGTCPNAYILQSARHILLLLAGAVTSYSIRFPLEDIALRGDQAKNEVTESIVEKATHNFALPKDTIPCCFDGKMVYCIQQKGSTVWNLLKVDCSNNFKIESSLQVRLGRMNSLGPKHVAAAGNMLLAVINKKTIRIWDVQSDTEIHTFKTHSEIVCIEFRASPVPALISVHMAGFIEIRLIGSHVLSFKLDKNRAQFRLNIPYFVRVLWRSIEDSANSNEVRNFTPESILYNDDSGVHLLNCSA